MKKFLFLINIVFILSACTPSESAIQTAVAQTQVVKAFIETLYGRPTLSPSITPTILPTTTFTQTPEMIKAIVNIYSTYLYAGPSPNHKMVICGEKECSFPRGTKVNILEKKEQWSEIWFFISMPDGETGWLYSGWLLIDGNLTNIPTASYIPTFPFLSTSIPTIPQPPTSPPNPPPYP